MRIFNKNKIYLFDGSKGYMLQKYGLKTGELAEEYNISNPDIVMRIYSEYCDAGSDIIQTNTLCSNRAVLERHNLSDKIYEINNTSVDLAKQAVGSRKILVAASIGPIGELLEPLGNLKFNQAYDLFVEQIDSCKEADVLNFETFTDLREMRIAIIANQDTINIPVISNMTYEKNNVTMMGHTPFICSAILKKMGADVVGVNCSNGPEKMSEILKQIACFEDFVCVKPNAGVPSFVDNKAHYNQTKEQFCSYSDDLLQYNIGITGGCCGTTPEYIKSMNYVKEKTRSITVEIDSHKYIMSQYCYIDIEKPFSTYEWIIDNENLFECIDKAYDISEKNVDSFILSYKSDNADFISQLINQIQDILRKPLIFEFENELSINAAIRSYCGIAGVYNYDHKYSVKI